MHKYYAEKLNINPDTNGILNVRVTFDGSWQKRGHTSLFAVGVVIDAETGVVLDYECISKYCEQCTKKEKALEFKKIRQEQFNDWLQEHTIGKHCMKNYSGSSEGIEAAAAVRLYGRSLEKKLRYHVFISDGDSSAFDPVCNMNDGEGPYGDIKVTKDECINHVSERLGTALRKLRLQVVTEKKNERE